MQMSSLHTLRFETSRLKTENLHSDLHKVGKSSLQVLGPSFSCCWSSRGSAMQKPGPRQGWQVAPHSQVLKVDPQDPLRHQGVKQSAGTCILLLHYRDVIAL